jgi:hypothetical protein
MNDFMFMLQNKMQYNLFLSLYLFWILNLQ